MRPQINALGALISGGLLYLLYATFVGILVVWLARLLPLGSASPLVATGLLLLMLGLALLGSARVPVLSPSPELRDASRSRWFIFGVGLFLLQLLAVILRWLDPVYDYWVYSDQQLFAPDPLVQIWLPLPLWAAIEELVFRRVQLRWEPALGRWGAAMAVGVAFGVYHLHELAIPRRPDDLTLLASILGGLVFSLCYAWGRSVLLTTVLHATYNLLAVAQIRFHLEGSSAQEAMGFTVPLLLAISLALWGRRRGGGSPPARDPATPAPPFAFRWLGFLAASLLLPALVLMLRSRL